MKTYLVNKKFNGVIDIVDMVPNTPRKATSPTFDLESDIRFVDEIELQRLLDIQELERTTKFTITTEEQYDEMLSVVPPYKMGHTNLTSYFIVGEAMSANLNSIFIKFGDNYYTALKSRFITAKEIDDCIISDTTSSTIFKHGKFIQPKINISITKSEIAVKDFASSIYPTRTFETYRIYALDNRLKVLGYIDFSNWSTKKVAIEIKTVLKFLIDLLATSYITIHNHPSIYDKSKLVTSREDIALAEKISDIGELLSIKCNANIIITNSDLIEDIDYITY